MTDATKLYATLDRVIAANAEGKWKQDYWIVTDQELRTDDFCGTAGCYAGHYVMLEGYTEVVMGNDPHSDRPISMGLRNPVTGKKVDQHDIPYFAIKGLGLTDEQAETLFHYDNKLEDLKQIVDSIVAGEL